MDVYISHSTNFNHSFCFASTSMTYLWWRYATETTCELMHSSTFIWIIRFRCDKCFQSKPSHSLCNLDTIFLSSKFETMKNKYVNSPFFAYHSSIQSMWIIILLIRWLAQSMKIWSLTTIEILVRFVLSFLFVLSKKKRKSYEKMTGWDSKEIGNEMNKIRRWPSHDIYIKIKFV